MEKEERKRLEKAMKALSEGNIEALDDIYLIMSRGVFLLSLSILKNREMAGDILQETFILVAKNICRYELGSNAVAWIYKIARNLCYRQYSKGKKLQNMENIEVFDEFGVEDFSIKSNEFLDLDRALTSLNEIEREIVTLYSLGFKHREIAVFVGKPLGTVLWIFNGSIKKLKRLLEVGHEKL